MHSSYSCLENSMDRGAWWAPVSGVAKSWTGPMEGALVQWNANARTFPATWFERLTFSFQRRRLFHFWLFSFCILSL